MITTNRISNFELFLPCCFAVSGALSFRNRKPLYDGGQHSYPPELFPAKLNNLEYAFFPMEGFQPKMDKKFLNINLC